MRAVNVEWQPKFYLDLSTARNKAFEALTQDFNEWVKNDPVKGSVPVASGWHTITPELAESLLRRNPLGANRKANLTTILYYADQMKDNEWPATGQPILLSVTGRLLDGQHRLWACYLSGAPFRTYVVSDVPEHDNLFAYIDNSKPRNATAAVQTAGLNGTGPLAVKVVDMEYCYTHGLYTAQSVTSHPRLPPIYYVRAVEGRPAIKEAARLAISDFSSASELIGSDIVAFAALKITELHGDDIATRFFYELGGVEEADETSPVLALIKLLKADADRLKDQMKRHQKLANLILAFNVWARGDQLKKRWALQVTENFPAFAPPALRAAAE